jgi:hypothetical protein
MKAWLEDGILMLTGENFAEHEYVRTQLAGQSFETGTIILRGIGTAGGFVVRPAVSPLQPPEEVPRAV